MQTENSKVFESTSHHLDRSFEALRPYLADKHLIIAANRGPVIFREDEDGVIRAHRGGGGLVSAMEAALQATEATWLASARTKEDEQALEQAEDGRIGIPVDNPHYYVRLLPIEHQTYLWFYNTVSNRLLWFLQHYLWDLSMSPDITDEVHYAWANAYREVNKEFAHAVLDEAQQTEKKPIVLLQDYHLYLCGGYIKEERPDLLIHHFSHCPWVEPDYVRLLPEYMRNEIISGLLACDVVGFHIKRYAQNFLWCCEELLGAEVDFSKSEVMHGDKRTLVRHYPISIEYERLEDQATTPEVERYRKQIRTFAGKKKLILRVDRIELSKNIVRGLRSYRAFLTHYPRYQGKVVFLVLLYPSRGGLSEYRNYEAAILREAAEINDRFGIRGWQPVQVSVEDNFPQSLAGYREYDVLQVNPLFDGMNLVCKEGSILNQRNGVLILSENAGAYDELKEGAISVSPLDIEEGAEALHKALDMGERERKKRAELLKQAIRSNTSATWLARQIESIREAASMK